MIRNFMFSFLASNMKATFVSTMQLCVGEAFPAPDRVPQAIINQSM